jgi:hypothetical protein
MQRKSEMLGAKLTPASLSPKKSHMEGAGMELGPA